MYLAVDEHVDMGNQSHKHIHVQPLHGHQLPFVLGKYVGVEGLDHTNFSEGRQYLFKSGLYDLMFPSAIFES